MNSEDCSDRVMWKRRGKSKAPEDYPTKQIPTERKLYSRRPKNKRPKESNYSGSERRAMSMPFGAENDEAEAP